MQLPKKHESEVVFKKFEEENRIPVYTTHNFVSNPNTFLVSLLNCKSF